MSAPKGNRFWELRETHGRPPEYTSAEAFAQKAEEYFDHADTQYIEEEAPHVKLGIVTLKRKVPYLKEDVATFMGFSEWRSIEAYRERGEDFAQIVSHIENTIVGNKKRGAYVGQFNASIVARDLGLTEKIQEDGSKEVTIKVVRERKAPPTDE